MPPSMTNDVVNRLRHVSRSCHHLHLNVRFQYKADIRVDCSERPLSSESGHSALFIELLVSSISGHSTVVIFTILCDKQSLKI